MGVRARREIRRQGTRERILAAARELFASRGYEAVTMRRLAEAVEYTPPVLYAHFRDKETLFRSLCAEDFLALAGRFQAIAAVGDPVERLRQAVHAYLDFGLDHPHHYRLTFMARQPFLSRRESRPRGGDPAAEAYAFLRGTATDCIRLGRLLPEYRDPDQVAQMAWASAHGLLLLHIARSEDDWVEWRPARDTGRQLVDTLIRGLTGEEY